MQQDYDSSASGYLTDSFEEIGPSSEFLLLLDFIVLHFFLQWIVILSSTNT